MIIISVTLRWRDWRPILAITLLARRGPGGGPNLVQFPTRKMAFATITDNCSSRLFSQREAVTVPVISASEARRSSWPTAAVAGWASVKALPLRASASPWANRARM